MNGKNASEVLGMIYLDLGNGNTSGYTYKNSLCCIFKIFSLSVYISLFILNLSHNL